MLDIFFYELGDRWVVEADGDRQDYPDRRAAFGAARGLARERQPSRLISAPPGSAHGDAADAPDASEEQFAAYDEGWLDFEDGDAPPVSRPQPGGAPRSPAPAPSSARAARPARDAAAARPLAAPSLALEGQPPDGDPDWARLAGPAVLGRSLIVEAGGLVPPPWAGAERVEIDAAAWLDPELVARVRAAFVARTPVIYDLRVEPPDGPVSAVPELWSLPPDFEPGPETAWALMRANAIDARDPAAPRWAGAHATGASDVELVDGRRAYTDGGPLRFWTGTELVDGAGGSFVVIPAVAWERGQPTPLHEDDIDAELAADQRRAVVDGGARARVIAPAGSGKTRVLTERARHIVGAGVPPSAVCLVAFNKRAQLEMQERLADVPGIAVQTLNALALGVLNGRAPFASRSTRVRTIDEIEVRRLLGDMVKFPRRANTDPAAAWIDALSSTRLGLEAPRAVELEFGGDVDGFAEFFPRYRAALSSMGAVDFDEQIYRAIEALLTEPGTLAHAQRACRVMLVDEFQDLTPAHLLLIRLLSGPGLDVFGVGDDDQTIYGYSGATPDWLIEFDHYFPGAHHHALEVNYRCPAPVVRAADHLLSRNRRRVPKVITAGPDAVADADALTTIEDADPTPATVRRVQELIAGGAAPSDIAVLTRVNTLLVPVQVGLVVDGVPVANREGARFLDRTGVAAALSWLRIATGTRLGSADVQRAARRPGRSLSPRVVEWMAEQRDTDGLRRLAGRLKGKDSDKVEGFVDDVERIRALGASATTARLVEFVRAEIGLDSALATLDAAHRGRNAAAHSDDLRALIALGRLHRDPATFVPWLQDVLAKPQSEGGVQLSTVHRVKGLEWPHVVVHDATADIFPHQLSTDPEEERRVFHVALTRGRASVTLVAEARHASPFLLELAAPATTEELARTPVAAVVRTPVTAAKARRSEPEGEPGDPGLVDALKSWRLDRSRKDKVPAYVVLNDKSLNEIARRRPSSPTELLRINGIGPAKLERYGDEILAVLDEHCS